MTRVRREKKSRGRMVIIGGAEDRQGESRVLREFVRLAQGKQSRIVVISVASGAPKEVAEIYVNTFKRLGVGHVQALDIESREEANADALAEAVERATGVFFTGGNQLRVTRLLGGTKLDTVLHERHERGLVLAGTSAGAAMMSSIMIVGSAPGMRLRAGMVELAPGMDFLSGVLIDQHFEQRGRLRRLLSAVAQHPHDLGLGIDENTGVVDGHIIKVIGEGSVTVVDAGQMSYTNIQEAERSDLLAISGVQIHILPAGYRFDLQKRAFISA